MTAKFKIIRAIKRSEKAYELYFSNRLYFQALRIYKANRIVYSLLESFIYECEESKLDQVFLYLFHLEDWFASFELLERDKPAFEDPFVFSRFEGSPSFPGDFIENILKD